MKALPLLLFLLCIPLPLPANPPREVYVVPNFHPASCGWLTDWSSERNYCANSYFDHLDRVRDDAAYHFALSECNNLIAMMNFRPDRFAELKQRIREGRVELCNAFFLEPTINLSGGEALVKMGVEGLRWQEQVIGVRPRLSWMIDVTGMHTQMAQIVAGLGLEALVYCRLNPTGSTMHWLEAPDGTRTLAISPGHYLEWRPMFGAKEPLADAQLLALAADVRARIEPPKPETDRQRPDATDLRSSPRRTPNGAPVLILGGCGDYSLAPLCKSYPSAFLPQFKQVAPEYDVKFTTPSRYLDAVLPGIQSGAIQLPVLRSGTGFTYNAFWIQNPRVKSAYRRCEHQLQTAEMLATAASLRGQWEYPAQQLYHAWLLMCLNMDRNTLWGAAGGMVFEHERSWDARDRFAWVEKTACEIAASAARSLSLSQPAPPPPAAQEIALPAVIETKFYSARLDPANGALSSLRLKSGAELLSGPANVIVAERPFKKIANPADHMVNRPDRQRLADSNQTVPKLLVRTSPLTTVVEVESPFLGGGTLKRKMVFHHSLPRIDFETELNDLPDGTVTIAEFPLAGPVREMRRGVPYGFSQGITQGIEPAVRWSHYQLADAGVALLDQGLSGRELNGSTPVIYLYNAAETYRGYANPWLSGSGRHVLRYALALHAGDFTKARIAQMAWDYNTPEDLPAPADAAFLQSSDNVVVEALRREGDEIELRLAECLGIAGRATVTLHLPHLDAALTDMLGGHRQPLEGGPSYSFPVRPQQIVSMRFKTAGAVPAVKPLTEWDLLVPEPKRERLRRYLPEVKGHPPAGGQ